MFLFLTVRMTTVKIIRVTIIKLRVFYDSSGSIFTGIYQDRY